MPNVTKDIIEGASVTERRGVVQEIIDIAVVDELAGGSGWSAQALGTPGLPGIGDSHPHYPDLKLGERRTVPLSPRMANVELVYWLKEAAVPGSTDVRGGTQLISASTAVDTNNQPLYTQQTSYDAGGNQVTSSDRQGGTVEILIPRRTMVVSGVSETKTPGLLTDPYVGLVNSATWQGGQVGTWLCNGIGYDLMNNDPPIPTWALSYEFVHDPRGWQPLIVHINPETGKPCYPLVDKVSWKIIDWYLAVDFAQLRLFEGE